MNSKILGLDFFARPSDIVAIELIGNLLVYEQPRSRLVGTVVEAEAYFGSEDPASHAYHGKTPRNAVMFGRAGFSYVYFTYGSCHMLNVVTRSEGEAGAVLIRAVEPVEGSSIMFKRRRCRRQEDSTSGPGKLTEAFGITLAQNAWDMTSVHQGGKLPPLRFEENTHLPDILRIRASKRIGISQGRNLLYRFYMRDNRFVSKK